MVEPRQATAASVMKRDVVTIRDHWDIREALALFEQRGISGAPVVDAQGKLVGVLSLADIARVRARGEAGQRSDTDFYRAAFEERLPKGFQLEQYDAIPVASAMTPLVIDASEDTPVSKLAALMIDLHIHRVIITTGGRIAGIVSALDLVRLLRNGAGDGRPA